MSAVVTDAAHSAALHSDVSGAALRIDYEPPTRTWDRSVSAPAFYDWRETYPFLRVMIDALPDITAELRSATRWFDWPETALYKPTEGHAWKVYPFCHTFPGNDPTKTTWIPEAVAACPKTAALLRALPGIRTALFSRMGPKTSLAPHTGWADLANHVLRCHLPLVVPDSDSLPCGLIVDDDIRHHKVGDIIVFDDSKMHSAFNNHASADRFVLIFDLARPEGVPLGEALGSTTDELQGFIDYFK